MKGNRVPLAVTLLSLALLVLAFAGTSFLTAPIGILFRDAAGFGTATSIAQLAAVLTTICLFAAAACVAVPTALEPAGWVVKAIKVLPLYLMVFTLAAVIANLIGVGTLGSLLRMTGPVKLSLTTAWLGAGAVMTTVAVVAAAARANLSGKGLQAATAATRIALVPGLILTLAMLLSLNIVMTGQTGQSPAGGPAAPSPGTGGLSDPVTQFEIGGALMVLFSLIALVGAVIEMRTRRTASAAVTPIDYRQEAKRALVAAAAISAVAFAAIQLVPVSRDNPPVVSSVQWDSPQTKALVTRTCMYCHSDETPWPWYSYFAPGSWITVVHVNSARQMFNLSELDKLPASRTRRLAGDMRDAIRNGVMPPVDFLFMHPEAQLTPAEKEQLIQGLANSLK